MSKPLVKAGEIVQVFVHSAKHDKYLICICPETLKFIPINTNPWNLDPPSQIEVTKVDFGFLTHKSYVSVCEPIRLTSMELSPLQSAPHRRLGDVPAPMRPKIKKAAADSLTLTVELKKLIDKNL